jgi:hypothetical protein
MRNSEYVEALADVDERYEFTRRSGTLIIEVHYQNGLPTSARAREAPLPPPFMEVRFFSRAIAATSY